MQQTAREPIIEEVTSWPGVKAGPGRCGQLTFRAADREIGHLHGSQVAHLSFPKAALARAARAGTHLIENDSDVRDVIELLRLNYQHMVDRHETPTGAA